MKTIIFGAGQIAEVAFFYLMNDSDYKVVGFSVDSEYLKQDSFMGLPIVPFSEVNNIYPSKEYNMFIALSYSKNNVDREKKYREAYGKGYNLISYVSSKATIWPGLSIGKNCFILEDNTIQPFVKIGNNITLWSGNHIGHHSVIEDNCFISSHVVVSGGVHIESNCFLGVNATIRDHVKIGRSSIIGAGALILKDIPAKSVVKGFQSGIMGVNSDALGKI